MDTAIDTMVVQIPMSKLPQELRQMGFVIKMNQRELPYQRSKDYVTGDSVLLCPLRLSFGAKGSVTLHLTPGEATPVAPMVHAQTYPERLDDFAWKNNRNGYRVYGPALRATGERSSGIDFFAKRTPRIVLNKWYHDAATGAGSYHDDHGEGMYFYAVGETLGMGGSALMCDGKMCFSYNYDQVELLEDGPLRVVFRLLYPTYKMGDASVKELRTVICDAYSTLNHFLVSYTTTPAMDRLNVAMGCVVRKEHEPNVLSEKEGILAYCQPEIEGKGIIYAGLICAEGFDQVTLVNGNLVGLRKLSANEPLSYWAGGYWNRGYISSYDQWLAHLKQQFMLLKNPIAIK